MKQRFWKTGPTIRVSRMVGDSRDSKIRIAQWEATRSDGVPVTIELGRPIRNTQGEAFKFPEKYFSDMLVCECPSGKACTVHQR